MPTCRRDRDALKEADQAVVWFAVLQRGRHSADQQLARRALDELGRLGVRVEFSSPSVNGERQARPSPNDC